MLNPTVSDGPSPHVLHVMAWSTDEPAGGDKPSEEKKKESAAPVMSQSQGSPEPREERYA